jgi:3-dehydroquinate dehydratase/shikimate dehydrogenase
MSAPLLCVTVAAPTMSELIERRDAAIGADLIELRLDLVRHPDVTGALAGRGTPVVVTCRPTWEGGGFEGSEPERLKILKAALNQGAEYVDVEFNAAFHPDLIRSTNGKRIVISSHDFAGVPADLVERVAAMRSTGAEIVKIAIFARSLSDNLRLLELPTRDNTVLVAMGPAGVPTRVLAAQFRSRWSYAGDGYAPGQVAASRMRDEFRFRQITDRTAVYGVVGSPLTHSISPAMHNAVFRATGADAVYLPMVATSAEDFLRFANALNVKGASVTIPYKVDLYQTAHEVDVLSKQVGAINTLRRDDNRWLARNTDVSGFLAPLARRLQLPGVRATILGTGGAARAVAVALRSAGSSVTVCGRNSAKASEVAQLAGGIARPLPVAPRSWDLLVNATPVGTYPDVDKTPFESPFDGRVVYDLVYNPTVTRFLREAAAAGCETIGGLDMLIAQAEHQAEWWSGQRPPVGLMRQAALASLGHAREVTVR